MGTRRCAAEVTKRGYHGRQHAKTLMQLMGIAAIYPKPRTTVIDKAKYKYPYLLWLYVSDRNYRHIQQVYRWLEHLKYDGCNVGRGHAQTSGKTTWGT